MDEEKQVETQEVETIETDNSSTVVEEQPQIEEEIDSSIPTVDDYNQKVREAQEQAGRAKRAEAKLKELQGKISQKPLTNQELSPDEIRLLAKGVSDEDITYLKRQQAGANVMGENVSLSKLYEEDPAYLALLEKRAKEERSKKASLGASGRSATNSDSPIKPDMSREDHKKVWEQVNKELGV